MRIVMLEPLGIAEKEVMNLAKGLTDKGHEFEFCGKMIDSSEEIMSKAADADALIIASSPLKGDVIRAAKNLKMISVAFTGVDHVDAAACNEQGVIVCNAQGYSTYAVAELTIGLILSVYRNIIPCDSAVRQGKTKDGLIGAELYGKTIGIVGTGEIGRRVAQLAQAFGCRVIGYSRSVNKEALKLGIEYMSLESLMAESDIVSLHTPLTNETKNMINSDTIALMKPTAILINAARGPIVDSAALAAALNDRKIAGAGIDVFESEPPIPADHPLCSAKNAVLTPHVAFAAKESFLRRAKITFDNIQAWMDGKPQNIKIGSWK